MKKTMLRNCMIFGLMVVLIGIPNIPAEPQTDYDALVTFRFEATEAQGYYAKVVNFHVPDTYPKDEPFKVQVEFDYHIGMDEAWNIKYDVYWGGYVGLDGGGIIEPDQWHEIAYVNSHGSDPGVSDKETFTETYTGLLGDCEFEAYCWMVYYVYVWDDVYQKWNYWKEDNPSDIRSKTISFPINQGCPEGTQITMASGIGPITKPIEDIGVGELILSYDPILQVTTAAEVIEVCIYTEGLPDHNLIFNGNLEVTPSHTLYINGIGWMEAEYAQMGYYMLGNIPDTPDIYPVIISSKEPTGPAGFIYDLVIQPLAGEAIGYWADGILVGGYD